jgi:hypothetical protein
LLQLEDNNKALTSFRLLFPYTFSLIIVHLKRKAQRRKRWYDWERDVREVGPEHQVPAFCHPSQLGTHLFPSSFSLHFVTCSSEKEDAQGEGAVMIGREM